MKLYAQYEDDYYTKEVEYDSNKNQYYVIYFSKPQYYGKDIVKVFTSKKEAEAYTNIFDKEHDE